ncbi:MAG TPA: ABC transporter permease [Chloroflexia bacterium]|jgi:peptide/nickel transport system permease protein
MTTYIVRRVIQGLMVLMLSTFVIYSILILTPGGPVDQVAELRQNKVKPVNEQYLQSLLEAYKLDDPYPINYLRWLFDTKDVTEVDTHDQLVRKGINIDIFGLHIEGSGALTGDFGRSLQAQKGRPVLELMGERLGPTLALTASSLFLSILIAIPIGIVSAIRQYSRLDYTVTGLSFVGISMPTFWFGLMLVIFLAVLPKQLSLQPGWEWVPYLPPTNSYDLDQQNNIINRIYHLVLPVTVLAIVNIAGFSRYVRSSMLEVLKQDYVRTAWAKGLAERSVIMKHALRNALIPVITVITLSLPFLFSGAIATETVFAYPGMGQLFVKAIFTLDFPLVMAFLLIVTLIIIFSNILADVLYAVADPRIRFS